MTVLEIRLLRSLAAVLLSIFILIGCSPPEPSIPNTALADPVLTVVEAPVQITRADETTASPQKDETVPVQVNDVLAANDNGRGLIRFKDRVSVDLLRGAEFIITGIAPTSGDFLSINLEHTRGHIRVKLNDDANARVRLNTSIATVTTLEAGTDYIICHNAAKLTCIVVLSGEVEVVGQGKLVTIKGGEATYVLKDSTPFSPICAQMDEVNAWIDQMLGNGEVPPISQLVSSWNPEPCSAEKTEPVAEVQASPALPSVEGMVKVGAGEYTIGVDMPNENQIATQTIVLNDFWIDRYEVTNAQYQAFIEATGRAAPAVWPGGANRPVAGVTWSDAQAYCTWAQKRLPSEAEWEAAARGPGVSPPLYPWGNDTQAGGEINALPRSDSYDVGSFTFNQSPFGVYDMAGNVWEWVGDPYAPVAEYSNVLRGGRYGLIKDMAYREQVTPDNQRFNAFTGFRCAADQVEGN